MMNDNVNTSANAVWLSTLLFFASRIVWDGNSEWGSVIPARSFRRFLTFNIVPMLRCAALRGGTGPDAMRDGPSARSIWRRPGHVPLHRVKNLLCEPSSRIGWLDLLPAIAEDHPKHSGGQSQRRAQHHDAEAVWE